MANINLQMGFLKTGSFILKDPTTNQVLTTGYSNLVLNNSNPEVANFQADSTSPDPESKIKATPAAVGSGNLTISVDVTYTDPGDGVQRTETKSMTKTFEVAGTPHGASLELVFP